MIIVLGGYLTVGSRPKLQSGTLSTEEEAGGFPTTAALASPQPSLWQSSARPVRGH